MPLWVLATVVAALLQSIRTADQRVLVGRIGNHGANLARYAYGAPFAIVALGAVALADKLPALGLPFLGFCLLGGLTQILATGLLLHAQHVGSYAVGTTFSKTEAVQAAVFSVVVLSETLSWPGWCAVGLSTLGVVLLSLRGRDAKRATRWWRDPAALAGLGSGALFALSSVAIRSASLSLAEVGAVSAALTTLAVITTMQSGIMVAFLAFTRDQGLAGLVDEWRMALRVGVLSAFGSALWFLAMTLQNVAYVRALGQVELAFMVAVARLRFAERLGLREFAGVTLVGAGVVVLLTIG